MRGTKQIENGETSEIIRRSSFQLKRLIYLTLGLMILGGSVRITESGLACPDWPLCYDKLVPHFSYQIFLEWIHRVYAGALGIYFLHVSYCAISSKKVRQLCWRYLIAAVVIFSWQVILGGLTVLHLLNPTIVSWHLINATLFLALLILMESRLEKEYLNKPTRTKTHHLVRWSLVVLTTILFLQILLGGIVSSNYAGPVCTDLPKCGQSWWPNQNPQAMIHMSHRFFGVIVLFSTFSTLIFTKLFNPLHPLARRLYLLGGLVTFQFCLGLLLVYFSMPTSLRILHLGNALFCFTLALSCVCRSNQSYSFFGLGKPKKRNQMGLSSFGRNPT